MSTESLRKDASPPVPPRGVTVRAMAFACALMPVQALFVVMCEIFIRAAFPTTISLFMHTTVAIFVLALANLWVRRRWPRVALAPGEMLTVYVMLSIASTLCSHDLIQILVPMLAYPQWAANPMNRWEEILLARIPDWAIVTGHRRALEQLAAGNSWLYSWDRLALWARPVAVWFLFISVLMTALTCLNVLFRRQWCEQEKLSFPIIQIPLLIAQRVEVLLASRLFWLAFGIAGFINVLNGFAFYYEWLPQIPLIRIFVFGDYLVERPWDAIADMRISIYPFVIGLAFFMPVDLAFSCWFFFLFYKAQLVLTSALGIRDIPGFPFTDEQAAGGYLAVGITAVFLARRHLWRVLLTALGRPGGLDDSREPLRYRTALIGLVLCTAIMVAYGVALAGKADDYGADPGRLLFNITVMLAFFAIFFLYAVAIARMRAELGPPAHDVHFMGPDTLIHNAIGTRNLGDGNLTAFSMFFFFNRAYRAHFSPHNMEGLKIAQLNGLGARALTAAMLLAVAVGGLSAFWAVLHLFHDKGWALHGPGFAHGAWGAMAAHLGVALQPKLTPTFATLGGLLTGLALYALRMRFTWFVFHPVGYAVSASWTMQLLWAGIFLGWLSRLLISRYGGAPAYRAAAPFFVGLVLGEFTVGMLWALYGAVTYTPIYNFFEA